MAAVEGDELPGRVDGAGTHRAGNGRIDVGGGGLLDLRQELASDVPDGRADFRVGLPECVFWAARLSAPGVVDNKQSEREERNIPVHLHYLRPSARDFNAG